MITAAAGGVERDARHAGPRRTACMAGTASGSPARHAAAGVRSLRAARLGHPRPSSFHSRFSLRAPMQKTPVATTAAPAAIGPYSQGVIASGPTLYLSGQIGFDPATMQLVAGVEAQAEQVFRNLAAVAAAAGASLADAVRITLYLVDLADFGKVNDIMARHFPQPFPTRTTIGVAALPRGALVEADAILVKGGAH